jgi:hypothetical protein
MSATVIARGHSSSYSPVLLGETNRPSRSAHKPEEKSFEPHVRPSTTFTTRQGRDSVSKSTSAAEVTLREAQEVKPNLLTSSVIGGPSVPSNYFPTGEVDYNSLATGNRFASCLFVKLIAYALQDQYNNVLRFIREPNRPKYSEVRCSRCVTITTIQVIVISGVLSYF